MVVEIHAKRVVRVEWPRDSNQDLSEAGKNAKVACFVGVG